MQELVDQAGLDVIGHRIRRLRTRQNYSIRDLADIAQVSKNTLLRLEQGHPTHLSTIVAVCKALKVKTSSVVGAETPQASIRAIHKVSDYTWMDMNNFYGNGQDVHWILHWLLQISSARCNALFEHEVTVQ